MTNFLRAPCDEIATSATSPLALSKKNEMGVLAATILGTSMAFIDNVALPALQAAFHISISQMQWLVASYSLLLAALLLVGGALGDLYGRRIIFLVGVFIFTAASVFCGLAITISGLITARAIQGVGAALLIPGSLALISASFPEERRGQAIGIWSGFTAITAAAGPVVGGWLVDHLSWRWIFFLNLPLAIAVFVITLIWVPESKNEDQCQKLDIMGAFLATTGLGAIVFGLIEWSIVAEMIGVCALVGFFLVEAKVLSPMVPLGLFKSRNFSGANLITFFLYFAFYGVLFFLPLDLIQVQGYTATQAGAALLPLIFFLSRWSGGLVNRLGARLPLIIGPAIAAVGFALLLWSGIGGIYWTRFFPGLLVLGMGMAVSVAPLTTVVMSSIPQDHAGAASGVNNAVSRVAGLLAVASFGLIMSAIFNQNLIERLEGSAVPKTTQHEILAQRFKLADINTNDVTAQRIVQESFDAGYKVLLLIAAILSIASSISAGVFISGKDSSLSFKKIRS
jgi:EmrB/QacA subfamily drug resistance transporter